ncbi:MAG: response regulator [Candidatus Pacebacteria bacterium]|nr:response regulator [Candidatus Paceibacterota bacterium]
MAKVLFIEDESALQKSLGDLLRQEGIEVISAIDGETGLRLAKETLPDLILLDLILPRMHGLEVLKKIKEEERTKDIPVVILTNLENLSDVEKAIELGATTYLVKANYSLEEIVGKVKNFLNYES